MSHILGIVGLVHFYNFTSFLVVRQFCIVAYSGSGIGSAAIHCPP
jgi:hypothetical protein